MRKETRGLLTDMFVSFNRRDAIVDSYADDFLATCGVNATEISYSIFLS